MGLLEWVLHGQTWRGKPALNRYPNPAQDAQTRTSAALFFPPFTPAWRARRVGRAGPPARKRGQRAQPRMAQVHTRQASVKPASSVEERARHASSTQPAGLLRVCLRLRRDVLPCSTTNDQTSYRNDTIKYFCPSRRLYWGCCS